MPRKSGNISRPWVWRLDGIHVVGGRFHVLFANKRLRLYLVSLQVTIYDMCTCYIIHFICVDLPPTAVKHFFGGGDMNAPPWSFSDRVFFVQQRSKCKVVI